MELNKWVDSNKAGHERDRYRNSEILYNKAAGKMVNEVVTYHSSVVGTNIPAWLELRVEYRQHGMEWVVGWDISGSDFRIKIWIAKR